MNDDEYVLDYDELRRIYRLESKSTKLSKLNKNFYKYVKKYFISEKNKYISSIETSFSNNSLKRIENLKKIINKIREIRLKKCMNLCLMYSRTNQFKEDGLIDFEVDFAKSMIKLIDKQTEYTKILFGQTKNKKEKEVNLIKVKFLEDVPSFVGADMKEYGPFEKNKVCELPEDVCKILSSRNIIKEVE